MFVVLTHCREVSSGRIIDAGEADAIGTALTEMMELVRSRSHPDQQGISTNTCERLSKFS